jgi:hypothetical protein
MAEAAAELIFTLLQVGGKQLLQLRDVACNE